MTNVLRPIARQNQNEEEFFQEDQTQMCEEKCNLSPLKVLPFCWNHAPNRPLETCLDENSNVW